MPAFKVLSGFPGTILSTKELQNELEFSSQSMNAASSPFK